MTSFTVEAGGAFSMWRARCIKHLQMSIKSPILRAGLLPRHPSLHSTVTNRFENSVPLRTLQNTA
jgi:hypothetical protein